MYNFITCPICSGHEKINAEAADAIAVLIRDWLERFQENNTEDTDLYTEMYNIRNVILNTRQRETVREYTPPICPTPRKRQYSSPEHAEPDAGRWHQHSYHCACGWWHLSKQTPAEHTAKINSLAASPDEFETVETIDPLLL